MDRIFLGQRQCQRLLALVTAELQMPTFVSYRSLAETVFNKQFKSASNSLSFVVYIKRQTVLRKQNLPSRLLCNMLTFIKSIVSISTVFKYYSF